MVGNLKKFFAQRGVLRKIYNTDIIPLPDHVNMFSLYLLVMEFMNNLLEFSLSLLSR